MKAYAGSTLDSFARSHDEQASAWARLAADAARWGLGDDHAEARHRAQSLRIEALLLRSLNSGSN